MPIVTEEDGTHEGWPDVVGDTALTIKVPEADPLVRAGFPAHITVLYPFLHVSRVDGAVHRELTELFGSHDAFEVTFKEFGRFPGVLYLDPWPKDPLRALTKELTERWPEAEPYRGIFDGELDPHLTLAVSEGPDGYGPLYDALEAELEPFLPITAQVAAVHLVVWDGSAWQDDVDYALGRPAR
ncbi:2'-5' RNA ligase family protein [Streptomyces albidus (ex Kaewkla and Franco 2022)]|uniref:2'-5' RNA ligase family protein n=1 Tax=Streptomyces albidus (ex Kaewkla and Franco 2022) TaxID=722709 RepID=UPI0015EE58E0|nr:2'-5' RNA ligase family protein [Streptomyces albidus (ex Kaewkla and Franco 2022)]